MKVVICNSNVEAAYIAADMVTAQIESKPNTVLGLATGSSPLALYEELVNRYRRGDISFACTTMFLLDEYVGLPVDHPQSFKTFIRRVFTDQIDVKAKAVYVPEGNALDDQEACRKYEVSIAEAEGIDLQILGIGSNGHIGFNEPSSSLASRTRLITLTEQTQRDNAPYFDHRNDMPTQALTQGIGTILDARSIILVAFGLKKRDVVKSAVEGPVTAMMPASSLQLHPNVTILIDEAAASELEHSEYYRSAFGGVTS
ncbi:MAG: glucosamine-6-phosphate deaminase [Acidimicrobiia bacterium]|nr:glucosamine-6-phosphate deaminase [Acidimicrobiia bacterium]MYC58356.1 glucosamine-6-phosphate deaminase [Acidimicrobiia bacterium]MYI31120.1 glucosamine-6-phosphate deaminase [Acidimicrobiia bacterium]